MDRAFLGDRVADKVNKHVSKWDLVADAQCSSEYVHDYKSGEASDAYHDKELNSGWKLSKSARSKFPRSGGWSAKVAHNTMRSKDSSFASYWEPMPEGKIDAEDVSVYRGDRNFASSGRSWGRDQDHHASFTPHVNARRQRSCSHSRSPGWGRPCRSRSRSPPDFRHEARIWNGRDLSGRVGSTEHWRDLAVGQCGSRCQWRFLHQDDSDFDDWGLSDNVFSENWGLRQGRGGFSGYADNEPFTDSEEETQSLRDEFTHSYQSHHVGEQEKHGLQRNNISSARSDDFLKFKCYRGSACKCVHGVNAASYDERPSKEAKERAHNRRERSSLGHYLKSEPHRSMNTLCKYFAEGRCRDGERCRFSHKGRTFGGPRERFQDGRWGDSLVMGNRSREGSKWSDSNSGAGVTYPENHSWNNTKWSDKKAEKKSSIFSSSRSDNNGKASYSRNRLWEGPKWDDKAVEENISISSQVRRKDKGTRGIVPESRAADQFGNGADMGSSGANGDGYPESMSREENIHNSQTSIPDGESLQQYASASLLQPVASENSCIQQLPALQEGAAIFPCEDPKKLTNSAEAQNGADFWGNSSPAVVPMTEQSSIKSEQKQKGLPSPSSIDQCFDSRKHNQQIASPPRNIENLNPERQSEEIIPTTPHNSNPSGGSQQITHVHLNGKNVNLNGESQPMVPFLLGEQMGPSAHCDEKIMQPPTTDQSLTLLGDGDLSKKPGLPDGSTLQLASEILSIQNVATTEKASQLTDLSASLAQIFGNGQQLPQLYATLNHLSASGLVPALQNSQPNPVRLSASTATPFIHSEQGSLTRSQCDPTHNCAGSIELDNSDACPEFSVDTREWKNTSSDQCEAPQQILSLPSIVTGGPDEGRPAERGSLETSNCENDDKLFGLSMDTEVVEVNGAAPVQCKKDQQNGQLKDMDSDDQIHEEGKRSKDAKGMRMRMFKFALVEFVKELLKPTWKEGNMSKEAHKTIVKKVVDKVMGSLHSPHIPHTQEKINQYLSFSKPKLTKLVHAYVEKYLKT